MKFIYKWLIALLLAIEPSLMWSDDNLPSDMRLGAESMPLASAFDCVNLITGDFFLTDTSVTLEGPCPLHYSRFYDSGLYYSNHRGFGNGIHLPLRLGHMNRLMRDDKEVMLIVEEREAATVAYFGRNYGEVIQAQVDPKVFAIGYKNYSETGIAGVDSIKNKQLRFTAANSAVQPIDGDILVDN